MATHVLWEHEIAGSSPASPTIPARPGGIGNVTFARAEYLCPMRNANVMYSPIGNSQMKIWIVAIPDRSTSCR